MRVCLIGYIDNTEENNRMLETYELRNDFWAERFKFRRQYLAEPVIHSDGSRQMEIEFND